MIKTLLLFIIFSFSAFAEVTSLDEGLKKSPQLRAKKLYREDIKLNQGLIKKFLSSEHIKLSKLVKNNESVDSISPELQKIYLTIYADYYQLVLQNKETSTQTTSDFEDFNRFYQFIDGLEIKVKVVNRIYDKAVAHYNALEGSVYKKSSSLYLQYISWQEKVLLDNTTAGTKHKLNITNKVTCLGGDLGKENEKYHFYLDGCAMIGSGTVSGQNESIYAQASLPLMGFKLAPGASLISTSSRSRFGLKFPFMYSTQKISDFDADGNSYVVKKKENFFIAAALYGRWNFKNLYISSELGKFVIQQEAYWAFGLGLAF